MAEANARFAPLTASDLDDPVDGTPVLCEVTVTGIEPREATGGLVWAVLDTLWAGRPLRLVVFPTQWRFAPPLSPGDRCVVTGAISSRSGEAAVVRVLSLALNG